MNPGAACLVSIMLVSSITGQAQALELSDVVKRLGPNLDQLEGLATRAACTGPDGRRFTTEVVSREDGTTRFLQVHEEGQAQILVNGADVYQRRDSAAQFEAAPPPVIDFVRGHEVHRMLLELDRRFSATGEREGDCHGLVQANGQGARLCLDPESGQPQSIATEIAPEIGGGSVRIELSDWRETMGVALPYAADFVHGEERFRYIFTEVLPFRLAPGAPLPVEPGPLFARLGDLAEIASVHRRGMQAHLESDVKKLTADQAPEGTVSGRGELSRTTPAEMRNRLGPYLEASRFRRYEDLVAPVVAVSMDGTLGWLACEMEAEGSQTDSEGQPRPFEFGFSWVEMLGRDGDRWVRIGNASSARP